MKEEKTNKENKRNIAWFFMAILNFFIIILLALYIIYLRFIPYETLTYDGYAVAGKEITNNLLDATFQVNENIQALKVKDQDMVYKNLRSYYIGASKTQNINLDYPIYVNDNLALYNLSQDVSLITSDLETTSGYKGFTLTSGVLYNSLTLERADFCDYILMKNAENLYINCKEMKIKTYSGEYKIPMNSIMNITNKFITYYSLNGDYFVYNKILDVDDNSQVIIEDYNKQYTYKELLIALGIIRAEVPPKEIIKEDTTKDNKEDKDEENKEENIIETPVIEVPDNTNNADVKWIKPEVKATGFTASTYIAFNEVEIKDPSGAICKAPTFTFYKDGKVSFRRATNSSGRFNITKLCPNTTYEVEGTYQYINQDGDKIEVTFYKSNFTTLGTENIKAIDLTFENGEIYENKIELKNFGITSDITDEAIYGVVKAVIEINGIEYKISSLNLKQLLRGERITYQTEEGLESNTKYSYKIKFYDTNNDEMKLNSNTGETNTLKAVPTVKISAKSNDLKTTVNTTLRNEDKVRVENYRYELLTAGGELIKQGMLEQDKDKVIFQDLEIETAYVINVYGDYDIEDGKGMQYNKLIGTQTFVTNALLGKLKLNISSDEEKLTSNEAGLVISVVNKEDTDALLIQILKSFKIKLRNDSTGEVEKEISFDHQQLNSLKKEENVELDITNLESNSKYIILVEAIISQGGKEKKIDTSYDFNEIITKKSTALMSVNNVVTTDNFINFNFIIDDKDGAIGDEKEKLVTVRLETTEENGSITVVREDEKYLNKEGNQFEFNYTGLEKNKIYKLTCKASKYNESQDSSKIQTLYLIGRADRTKEDEDYNYVEFKTEGLTGKVTLDSLKEEAKKDENGNYISKNLVNVKSKNNWYSECFDVLEKGYDYKKIYDQENNVLTFGSNQSYVYNLNEYNLPKDTKLTMSFEAMTNNENADVKIQNSKNINKSIVIKDSENRDVSLNLNTTEYKKFSYDFEIGEDGYVGFYLPQIGENRNLYDGVLEQGSGIENTTTRVRTKNLIQVKKGVTYKFSSNNYSNFKYVFNSGSTNSYGWEHSELGYCGNSTNWTNQDITFTATKDGYLGLIIAKTTDSDIVPTDLTNTEIKIEEIATDYELYIKNLQIKIYDGNDDYESYQGDLNLNATYSLLENQEFTKLQNYYVRLSHIEEENIINDADICEVEVTTDDIKDANNKAIEEKIKYVIENRPNKQTDFRLELIVKLYDRDYTLDSINFSYIPGKCEEIESIEDTYGKEKKIGFMDIQPDGNYFFSSDISLTQAKTVNQYTFGNEKISFNGIINFNGNTLGKTTYSSGIRSDVTPYVFYKLSDTAKIQNLVINFNINNIAAKDYENVYEANEKIEEEESKGIYSLFLYNDGEISNVILNLEESTKIIRKYVGLLGYNNNGTIDKFVINLTKKLYGTQYISGCVLYSSGVIQNGYIYGDGGIESYGAITSNDTRYFAGIVYKATSNTESEFRGIKNVYNNSRIRLHYIETLGNENAYASNIAYRVDNNVYVENIYSINATEVTREKSNEKYKSLNVNKKEVENGPNIFKVYSKGSESEVNASRISNSFYFSETYYSNSIDIQGNSSSLKDTKYQTGFLGDYGFEFRDNYYPIVKMNSCMPNQEWILISDSGADNINILSAQVLEGETTDEIIQSINNRLEETFGLGEVITGENGTESRIRKAIEDYESQNNVKVTDENIYVAEISLYNSRNSEIDEEHGVDIDFVDEHIIGQGKGNQRTLLYAIIDNPQIYYNTYNISKISYKTWVDGVYTTVEQKFGGNEPLGKKTINMKFVKKITNAEEWCNIDQYTTDAEGNSLGVKGLVQNYRLVNDIDFNNSEELPNISGIFEGEITAEKIQVEEEKDGVKQVVTRYPILKNINLSQETFFEILNGKVENLNIENYTQDGFKEFSENSKYYLGFIGMTDKKAIINNIHLKNINLSCAYNETNINANCYVAGIICEMTQNVIKNSSVSGLYFDCTRDDSNKQFNMAMGGIVGYATSSSKTIENCYVQNFNVNLGNNITSLGIGGILGRVDDSENSKITVDIKYCYSTGNITTYQNYIGGIFGKNKGKVEKCYSTIDITSNSTATSTGAIGGIGGHSTTASENIYNLYTGNMYVKKTGMSNVNNIIGSSDDKNATDIIKVTLANNYAYSGQRINGKIDATSETAYGATLISSVAKKEKDGDSRICKNTTMKNNFAGNYYKSNIINSDGYIIDNLPLLYENEESRELMIWQDNIEISIINLKILGVKAEYIDNLDTKEEENNPKAKLTLTINNPDQIEVTGLEFEKINYIESMVCNSVLSQTYNDKTKNSIVELEVTPNYYYDTYKINKLWYKYNGAEKDIVIDTKVSIIFYKGVKKWDDFDYRNTYQNYKILQNINLNTNGPKKTADNHLENSELIVGRLVGKVNDAREKPIIGGTNDQTYSFKLNKYRSGLIKECSVALQDISFENIEVTSKASNTGIFSLVTANCKNISFNKITVNASGYSYIGTIAQLTNAKIQDIELSGITCSGYDYVGGLSGYSTLSGECKNMQARYTSVSGHSFVGGLIGRLQNTSGYLKNISAFQTDGESRPDNGFLVKGTGSYIGGCIGYAYRNLNTVKTNNSRIIGGSVIGACVGEAYWCSQLNFEAKDNVIQGGSYVGGIIGENAGYIGNCTSINNTITGTSTRTGGVFGSSRYSEIPTNGKIISRQNVITGAGQVGGVAGRAHTYYASYPIRNIESSENKVYSKTSKGALQDYAGGVFGYVEQANSVPIDGVVVKDNKVEGASYVGGAFGYSNAIIRNVKVTGKNDATQVDVSGINYVGGIVGRENYSYYNSSSSYYSINQAYASNMYIKATGSNIGGIAGYSEGTVYGTYIDNSNVRGGKGSKYIGGIVGYYRASIKNQAQYISSKNFYLKNSACVNTNIEFESGSEIGGIAGVFEYGNLENCYVVNCKINPTSSAAKTTCVGGLVGYLKNKNTQTNQYISKIRNNYVINYSAKNTFIRGDNFVGGVIGKVDRLIESDTRRNTENFQDSYPEDAYGSNLIITDILASGNEVSMGIGNYMVGAGEDEETGKSYGNQNLNMVNTYIYLGNKINNYRIDVMDKYGIDEQNVDKYQIVDYNWIKNASNYKNKLSFGTSYIIDSNISNNCLPILIDANKWSSLGITQVAPEFPIEEYFDNTSRAKSFSLMSMPINRNKMYAINTSVKEQFPKVYVYTSDVDKINVEFEYVNENTAYSICTEDGNTLYTGTIKDRVNTFKFDFKQSIKIKFSNGMVCYEEDFDINDIRNKLYMQDDEYFYLLNNKLYSNKNSFDGEFANLYEGKVISTDGKIYNVYDVNTEIGEYAQFEKLEESIPLIEYEYKGKKIETYYHCTKVIEDSENEIIKDKQMYIKNKSMYILDGKLDIYGNTAIIDSYNDKQYEAALGVDGKIYNFLNKIKYPLNFKNKDIIQMTSNIKNNTNIVLVYYSSGKVVGFNYITGEEVYDNGEGKVDLFTYIANSFKKENLLYDIENINYEDEKELIAKLEKISIDEAMSNIEDDNKTGTVSENNGENSINNTESNISQTNKDIQYTVAYDTSQDKYVVYSSEELFDTKTEKVISENEKIQSNANLENYYGNLSVSKIELNDIGIILFAIVIVSIGIILVVMKRKNIKD